MDFINEVLCGESASVMSQMPSECIDLVVTSPPYDSLREYSGSPWNFEIFSNIAYQLSRVLKRGGVIVWVVGDAVIDGSESCSSFKQAIYFKETCNLLLHDTMVYEKNGATFPARKDSNRYSQVFEFMFVFSKGKPKTANLICDKKNRWVGYTNFGKNTKRQKDGKLKTMSNIKPIPEYSPRNNIWLYKTGKGYTTTDKIAFKHPAIFPENLAKDHILTWSEKEDVVLDPFCGSGTTLKMALLTGRNYVGIDISPEYCDITRDRLDVYHEQNFIF